MRRKREHHGCMECGCKAGGECLETLNAELGERVECLESLLGRTLDKDSATLHPILEENIKEALGRGGA